MAIDPFIKAGSSAPNGDRDTMELAFYRARSGIADQTLSMSTYKQAYFRRLLGAAGNGLDIDTLSSMFNASGIKAFRRNLNLYPSDTTGTGTYGRSNAGTAASSSPNLFGNPCTMATVSAAGAASVHLAGAPNANTAPTVEQNKVYTGSVTVSSLDRALQITLVIEWFQGINYIGGVNGAAVSMVAGVPQRLSYTATAPAPATRAQMYYSIDGTAQAGDRFLSDRALFEQASSLGTYFDGSSGGCSWDGTANASTSSGYPGVNL